MSVVVQERRDPEDYAGEEENGESSSSGDVQFESDDRCTFCRYPLATQMKNRAQSEAGDGCGRKDTCAGGLLASCSICFCVRRSKACSNVIPRNKHHPPQNLTNDLYERLIACPYLTENLHCHLPNY